MPKQSQEEAEKLAEKLHEWYLEATKELNPKNYNPNAQKQYHELNDEQKFIDRYIAMKALQSISQSAVEEYKGELLKRLEHYSMGIDGVPQNISWSLEEITKLINNPDK